MTVWWGALAWIAVGLAVAVVLRLLPPWRGSSWWLSIVVGVVGASAGGVLATVLGFGGVAALDWRSIVCAGLGAVLAMLVFALARTRGQRSRRS